MLGTEAFFYGKVEQRPPNDFAKCVTRLHSTLSPLCHIPSTCQCTHGCQWTGCVLNPDPLRSLWMFCGLLWTFVSSHVLWGDDAHLWHSCPWGDGAALPLHPESRKCLGVFIYPHLPTPCPIPANNWCMSMEGHLLCLEVGPTRRCDVHSRAPHRIMPRLGLGLKSHILALLLSLPCPASPSLTGFSSESF